MYIARRYSSGLSPARSLRALCRPLRASPRDPLVAVTPCKITHQPAVQKVSRWRVGACAWATRKCPSSTQAPPRLSAKRGQSQPLHAPGTGHARVAPHAAKATVRVRLTSPGAIRSGHSAAKGLTDRLPLGLAMNTARRPTQTLAGAFLSRRLPAALAAPCLFYRDRRVQRRVGALPAFLFVDRSNHGTCAGRWPGVKATRSRMQRGPACPGLWSQHDRVSGRSPEGTAKGGEATEQAKHWIGPTGTYLASCPCGCRISGSELAAIWQQTENESAGNQKRTGNELKASRQATEKELTGKTKN